MNLKFQRTYPLLARSIFLIIKYTLKSTSDSPFCYFCLLCVLSRPHDCSTPGFPVLHCLLEFAQINVHWVSDAIQLSHPLLPPSALPSVFSQDQGFFQWVSSLHQVAKLLELIYKIELIIPHHAFMLKKMKWLYEKVPTSALGT